MLVVVGEHRYEVEVVWTGATTDYRSYSRNHEVHAPGPTPIPASADPVIGRGDSSRWNPEQLLVAALSQCHMLWYLHLCTDAGIVVVDYRDAAVGIMSDSKFTDVTLHPRVVITSPDRIDDAQALHAEAHRRCFIANSVNFPVAQEPRISARRSAST
jgi:organic hydroperoxide reductase OsmC/OhrA